MSSREHRVSSLSARNRAATAANPVAGATVGLGSATAVPRAYSVRRSPSGKGRTLALALLAGIGIAAALAWIMRESTGPLAHLDMAFRASAPAQAYPPPASEPSPTPPPDSSGRFPPPEVPHQVMRLAASPHYALLRQLGDALNRQSATTMASWIYDDLALEYPGATEGFGLRLRPASAEGLLGELFQSGSRPVIQGAFDQAGCDWSTAAEPCWPLVVVTGWQGQVPMPTRNPNEPLGPPVPEHVPPVAALELFADLDGPYWVAWWLGDGYYELVERLAAEAFGTYSVFR